jgi:zinc/manganese transport system substrate-binding protein
MKPRVHLTRALKGVSVALVLAMSVSACSTPIQAPTPFHTQNNRIIVTASVEVWASLAKQLGGRYVSASAIIATPNQDPHAYEATARDQLAVNLADITIENGLGYDPFFAQLTRAKPNPAKGMRFVAAGKLQNFTDSNPHVWYSLEATGLIADSLATRVRSALANSSAPNTAESYVTARHARFISALQSLEARVAVLAAKNGAKNGKPGSRVLLTENFATDFLASAGYRDVTPNSLYNAVQEGQDASPLLMSQLHDTIAAHRVDLVVLNSQAENPQSAQLAAWAGKAGIPVLRWSELLPAHRNYISWMSGNLHDLETLHPVEEGQIID